MYDVLEKIFAIIIAVLLMFFFPLLDVFERMDDLSFMTIYAATVRFVDNVRNTGRITPDAYLEFKQVVDATGNRYNIELVHREVNEYPEKDVVAGEEDSYGFVELYNEMFTTQILCMMRILVQNADGSIDYSTDSSAMVDYDDFNICDYFYASVSNISKTPATIIKEILYGTDLTNTTIVVPYGGMVRNIPNR